MEESTESHGTNKMTMCKRERITKHTTGTQLTSLLKRKICACRLEKVGSGRECGASVHAFIGCVAHVNKGLPSCVIRM